MPENTSRVLITGTNTKLGAAVRDQFDTAGAATVSACAVGADIRDAVCKAAATMGGLDTLVVAHPLPVIGAFAEQPMAEFWNHVDTVLTGSFLYAQAAAEVMRDSGSGGRIVLTTSRWHIGGKNLSAVATAAGGIVALTKTLTRDFGRFGIGVNAVAVGAVDSEWSVCDATAGGAPPPVGTTGTVEQVARLIGLLSQRRLVAAVGQIVNVDGGLSRNRV